MTELDKVAEQILNKTSIDPNEKFGDILITIMIIGIIVNLIRVMQECDKSNQRGLLTCEEKAISLNKQFKQFSHNRSLYHNMRLRRIMRKHMPYDIYQKYKTELQNAILDTAMTISNEQTYSLMESIHD